MKGKGEWNHYQVICIDGTIKLSVNGKFVNGISQSSITKGYLCLESEGAEIQFRNLKVIELPPSVPNTKRVSKVVKELNKGKIGSLAIFDRALTEQEEFKQVF